MNISKTTMNKPPITFKQVQEWTKNKQFDKFYRSPEVEQKYETEKTQLIKNLKTKIIDYLKQDKRRRWLIFRNDYPYYFAEDLEHWLIRDIKQKDWNKTKLDFEAQTSILERKEIIKEPNSSKINLLREIGCWQEREYWINPPQFRSISDISHIHLVRKVTTKEANYE